MKGKEFHRKNHYVSQAYLKKWGSSSNEIMSYQTIAPNENVPLWKKKYIKGVAYRSHLYTRIIAGGESDEIEKWLDKEYEEPVEEVFKKISSEDRLKSDDWEILVRFLAAQDVRTPRRLSEHIKFGKKEVPELLEKSLHKTIQKYELFKSGKIVLEPSDTSLKDQLPLSIKTKNEPDKQHAEIKVETIVGRNSWLFSIKHLLTDTLKILYKHRWTLLAPPNSMEWLTSDDPVVLLNYYQHNEYDFLGGWGKKGSEIFLPISPDHLLYTKVGERYLPRRGTKVDVDKALMMNRFIAEHAHRSIFATEPNANVSKYRPRIVDSEWFQSELDMWNEWHENQKNAEIELMNSNKL